MDVKRRKKKRQRLKNVEVDEISLVDEPAVPDAKFVLVKRDRPDLFAKCLSFDGGRLVSLYDYACYLERRQLCPVEFAKAVDTPQPRYIDDDDDLPPLEVEHPRPMSLQEQERAISILSKFVDRSVASLDSLRRDAAAFNQRIDNLTSVRRRR